jgi:hypothetical protein
VGIMGDEEENKIYCPRCNGKIFYYALDLVEFEVVPEDVLDYVDLQSEYRSVAICDGCEDNTIIFLSEKPLNKYVDNFDSRRHIYADLDDVPYEEIKSLIKDVVDAGLRLFSFIFSHYATWYSVPEKTWNVVSENIEIRDGFICIGEGFLHFFFRGKGSLHIYKEKDKYKVFILADNKDILHYLNNEEIVSVLNKLLSSMKLELERLKIIASLEKVLG